MITVLIAALAFFTLIACLRTDLAVFLIITLLPSYLIRFSILGIPGTFLEAMILITFAVWFVKTTKLQLVSWFNKRTERQPYPFGLEIMIILVVAFLAAAVTSFSFSAMGIFKAYFFEPILLFILIMNVLPGKKGRSQIILALLVGAAATVLLALFQQITGTMISNPFWAAAETRRVVSWFGYPNAVGLYLAPLLPLLIGYLLVLFKEKGSVKEGLSVKKGGSAVVKTAIALTVALSIAAIYFAKSEGALVGLLAGFWLMAILANKYTRLIAIIATIFIGAFIFINPGYRTYTLDKLTLSDLSGEIRKQQWRETWQSFSGLNLVFGHGLSGYPVAIAPLHQEGIFFNRDKMENFHSILYGSAELRAKYWQPVEIYLYPHNIFLNFWSELGILGMLAFIWLIGKFLYFTLKIFFRQRNYLALGLFGAMVVVVVHGLVDVPYFKNDLSALFFILLALAASLLADNYQAPKKTDKISIL